jgi:transcriptional regulator with XRE-family HTH domain
MMTGIELLVALRELSLSQRAFAERIGYREETVSRWVRDREPIPIVVEVAVTALRGDSGRMP